MIDIYHENAEVDARVMMYKRKHSDDPEKDGKINKKNQLWTVELADPPRQVDSDDEDEDDSKRARMRAWFGNWHGWGKHRHEALDESGLSEAHEKVYKDEKKKKKSSLR